MTTTLYGIPNCDTVKKARARMDGNGVRYTFHDYRKAGVDAAALDRWIAQVGWEVLLNRAGTTFRKLADTDKTAIDAATARALMLAYPSLIKRPVVEYGDALLIGFKPDEWRAAGL